MRRRRLLIAGFLAVTTGMAAHQSVPQFRTTVTGTGVLVVVRRDGRPVRDLAPSDFGLTDSGVRQDVMVVDAAATPLDVSIVVQHTSSVDQSKPGTFGTEIAAVGRSLGTGDRLVVVVAGDDQRAHPWPLPEALRVPAAEESTCVPAYDALARTLMRRTAPDRQHLVVLISVGEGSGSIMSYEPVLDIARRSNARLHVVVPEPRTEQGLSRYLTNIAWAACPRLGYDWSPSRQKRLRAIDGTPGASTQVREVWLEEKLRLVKLAELTGGGEIRSALLTSSTTSRLRQALDDVRAGYVLYYTPVGVPQAGWHPISVTINRPGKYDVRTREGYLR